MDFAILGPLEVRRAGSAVALGGAKPRALLAVLLINANELDVERFDQLVSKAREALDGDRSLDAPQLVSEALALWRGRALADLEFESSAQAEIARLEEQHLAGELQRIVAEHPRRERFHAQLMLALYRAGRQADALDAYRRARGVLVEELGLEPAPELQALHEAILQHDGLLQPPRQSGAATARHTVPAPPTGLIGRAQELRELADMLADPDIRLVTLVGPGGVGMNELLSGRPSSAGDAFAHLLRICQDQRFMADACEALLGLAAIAATAGNARRSATLLGAAKHISPIGVPWIEQALEQRFFAGARRDVGDPAWDAAHARGSQMDLDQAIRYGLVGLRDEFAVAVQSSPYDQP